MKSYCKNSIIVLFQLVLWHLNAQPHLKGTANIDLDTGLFHVTATLSYAEIGHYRILLNKGFNIKYIMDSKNNLMNYKGFYDGEMRGEAIEYSLESGKKRELSTFQMEYIGAFPIYNSEYNSFDFKGFIAINEQTLRASEQTKWYPVLYDAVNDKIIDKYTYDLTITIKGGKSIFINGSKPVKQKFVKLTSSKAVPLFLFVGDYDFIENNGNCIINANVTDAIAASIFKNINILKNLLSKEIGKSFEDNIYIINHSPINERKEGSSWGFNSYPTFAFAGLDFNNLMNDKNRFTNEVVHYFGHELGHNYFNSNVASGTLNWFWLESFPEYMALTLLTFLETDDYKEGVLKSKLKAIKTKKFKPLQSITNLNEINRTYRYELGPLIIMCFEIHFGKERTFKVISKLLEYSENETLTLKHWEAAAIISKISANDYAAFSKSYLSNANFIENIQETIKKILL